MANRALFDAAMLSEASGDPEHKHAVDLALRFPGAQARTHDLRATDTRVYKFFYIDPTAMNPLGVWSRSIDRGYTDWHLQTEGGMFYLGWSGPTGELYWATPPELMLPRYWDPTVPWSRTFESVALHRTNGDREVKSELLTVTVVKVVEAGEPLIHLSGVVGMSGEHWWLSEKIPVQGGGTAPGIRGFLIVQHGTPTAFAEFVEWVPRCPGA